MRETWLYPNRRAILFGCIPPLILVLVGAAIVFRKDVVISTSWRIVGTSLAALGLGAVAGLTWQIRRPRIAYQSGHVLFYLRGGAPFRVPLEIVESFFAGQSPAHLPALPKQPQTVNLIARLSQRHTEWAARDVRPALGKWSEGYVTIRGTWCEPLGAETIRRLNRRLKEVKDATKSDG